MDAIELQRTMLACPIVACLLRVATERIRTEGIFVRTEPALIPTVAAIVTLTLTLVADCAN